MTTTADLIAETKRHLQSFQREPMNKLAATVGAADTTLTFQHDVSHIQPGAHIQIGLELVYVWTVEAGSKTATVERAQLGSTAAAHTTGDVATINPKFPDFAILKAINDDLADLCSPVNGIYAIRTLELTGSAASNGYDLTGATGVQGVLTVLANHPGSARSWEPVTNYALDFNAETSDFASGYALRLHENVWHGRQLRVVYRAELAPLTTLADNVETVTGLPSSAHDLPPMGAAVAMVAPREIKRNFTEAQGEPRRAAEVPPGAVGSSLRMLASRRQNRITAEAAKLLQQYPARGFIPTGGLVG